MIVRIADVPVGDLVDSWSRSQIWEILGRNEYGDVMVRRGDRREHAVAASELVHARPIQHDLFPDTEGA